MFEKVLPELLDIKRIWANLFIRTAMRQQQHQQQLQPQLSTAMRQQQQQLQLPTAHRAKPNLDVARRLAALHRFLTPYTTLVAINDDLSRNRFDYHEVISSSQLMPARKRATLLTVAYFCNVFTLLESINASQLNIYHYRRSSLIELMFIQESQMPRSEKKHQRRDFLRPLKF